MTGLAAAGVDDPAGVVAALEPQGEAALMVEVEDDAALLQVPHRRGGFVDQHPYG